MKIGIFTPYSLNPIHPRLNSLKDVLNKTKDTFSFLQYPKAGNNLWHKLNWLFLGYFDIGAIIKARKALNKLDIVYIQDLSYLPIVIFAKRRGMKVIYETLDNNVCLRFYLLERHWYGFRYFAFISYLFKIIERCLAEKFADEIIVNSRALKEYFRGHAKLIYYTSPLENIVRYNNPMNPPAFLYLGAFTIDKGAAEILDLCGRYNNMLYILGEIKDKILFTEAMQCSFVVLIHKLSPIDLREQINQLLNKYYLIGLSLIHPTNYSYKTQEANKEIDYLACGIPLIGNYRQPTAEKILNGCGVFFNRREQIDRLLNEPEFKSTISSQAKEYYFKHYSQAIFSRRLSSVLKSQTK